MIRVELLKMLRRPRTWVTIALLNALPTLVAVLLAVTDLAPRPGKGPAFLSAVLSDAQAGTLRYLLVRPVGRTRLLVAKLVSTVSFVLLATVFVAVIAYGVGILLLGDGSGTAVTGVSGTSLSSAELVQRTVLSVGYVSL